MNRKCFIFERTEPLKSKYNDMNKLNDMNKFFDQSDFFLWHLTIARAELKYFQSV